MKLSPRSLPVSVWLFAALVSALRAAEAPASLAELEAAIRQQIEGQPGIYSVAFADLSSGERLLLNADQRTHAASLMKVPVMMTAFHRAERGEVDLEQQVLVKNTFASLVDGSPFQVGFDPNGPLVSKAGARVSLLDLIRLMITRSDNVATNLVMELVSAPRVMDLLKQIRIEDVIVRRGVEDTKAYEAGLNNECSARGMLEVMVACRGSSAFASASRRQMMKILRAQEISSMIAGGIPQDSGAVVAHKTGSISWVEHDAGIVELGNGRAYGLVILTWNFGASRDAAKQTAGAISELAYHYVSSR